MGIGQSVGGVPTGSNEEWRAQLSEPPWRELGAASDKLDQSGQLLLTEVLHHCPEPIHHFQEPLGMAPHLCMLT